MHSGLSKRDRVGQLPTQMTSEFHPLSQEQKSAVTTKAGCQGDPLYLSIKGTPCEDYSDLKNKQRIRSGTLASKWAKQESLNNAGKRHTLTTTQHRQHAQLHVAGSCARGEREHRRASWNKPNSASEGSSMQRVYSNIQAGMIWFMLRKSRRRSPLSTLSDCGPLPESCCQLACFNNGLQVIRWPSHTLFTSGRTGRMLPLHSHSLPSQS